MTHKAKGIGDMKKFLVAIGWILTFLLYGLLAYYVLK